MRKLGLTAAFVLMSTTAYAGEVHQFNIGGGTVRIEMRDCKRGSCPWVTWNEKSTSKTSKKAKADEAETTEAATPATAAPVVAAAAPVIAAPAASQAAAPPPPAAAPAPAPRPEDIAARAPVPAGAITPTAAPVVEPVRVADPSQAAKVEPRPQMATLAPAATEAKSEPTLTPVKAAKPVGPLGEWITEDGEGRVLVEECGANLCGKVSHAKNPNDTDKNNPDRSLRSRPVMGLPVLIDMKPKGDRWEGKVYNAKDGKTYTAKLSMRNPNTLRVEGCIMGGMLCGGQNWKRAQ